MPISIAGSGAVTGASTLNGLTVPTDAIAPGMVTVSQQSFSAASSISFNNCFSNLYANYRIIIDVLASTSAISYFRLRVNGSDDTTTNYHQQRITAVGTTLAGARVVSGNNWRLGDINTTRGITTLDIIGPMVPQATVINQIYGWGTGSCELGIGFHEFDSVATFDGFTFYPSTGNMTGQIRVYGYRNTP